MAATLAAEQAAWLAAGLAALLVVAEGGRRRPGLRRNPPRHTGVRMGSGARSPRRGRLWVAVGALAAVGTVMVGPLPVGAAVLGAVVATRWRALRRQAASRRAAVNALPDVVDLFVVAVRAGCLPAAAIRLLVAYLPKAVASAFTDVVLRLDAGQRFVDAIEPLPDALGPAARPLVQSLRRADHLGIPLLDVLQEIAADAHQQRRRNSESLSRQLPVRLAIPLATCTLPSFVLLAIVPLLARALSSVHL